MRYDCRHKGLSPIIIDGGWFGHIVGTSVGTEKTAADAEYKCAGSSIHNNKYIIWFSLATSYGTRQGPLPSKRAHRDAHRKGSAQIGNMGDMGYAVAHRDSMGVVANGATLRR